MAHVYKMGVLGNPNVGLYARATDGYCLVSHSFDEDNIKKCKDALQVPVIQINIGGNPLVGALCTGTKDHLIVPATITEDEKEVLNGIPLAFTVIETNMTALGNNVLCNDEVALVHPDFEPAAKKAISNALGVPVHDYPIAKIPTVGSLAVLNTHGCLTTHDANDDELDKLEAYIKVPVDIGTVNFGSPFVGAGIICNSKGFIIGADSTGVEISNADEVLGFVNQ